VEVKLKKVRIYTDGACIKNPGPGGYGTILIYGKHRKELSAGFRKTTNNRMEIMAAIAGLKALKNRCDVTIFTDSQYLVKAMEKGWVKKWKANDWKRTKTARALNCDLWEKLLNLCEKQEVRFIWIRGHSGDPENERCDQLAQESAQRENLPPDTVYENYKRNLTENMKFA
jgi:ribonuclease HI